jgi:hypothetical protein
LAIQLIAPLSAAKQLNLAIAYDKAITKLVGSKVANAILQMADGSNHKNIDKFTLYEVMKSAIVGADQQSTNKVLEQLLKDINHNFDFCKKVSFNM